MGPLAAGGERGTALVLMPALVLVLFALGGIAIDLSLLHSTHRGVHRIASAAADDAAAMIDTRALQSTGDLRIDDAAADRVVRLRVESAAIPGRLVAAPDIEVAVDRDVVDVRLTVQAEHVLFGAVPGGPGPATIVVTARGRLNR